MLQLTFVMIVVLLVTTGCQSEVPYSVSGYHNEETTTIPPPPVPYAFHYKAGRFPGNVDRYQSEAGDGAGVVQGIYAYIDPKFKIRTVEYTADKNGFHPILKNFEDVQAQPKDSEAVRLATERHHELYQRIASNNAHPPSAGSGPRESARAANRHFELYRKIAAEHEAIAAQREAERIAFEATSVPNHVEQPFAY